MRRLRPRRPVSFVTGAVALAFFLCAPLCGAALPPAFEGIAEAFLRFTPTGAEVIRRVTGSATVDYSAGAYELFLARLESEEMTVLRERLGTELEAAQQELREYLISHRRDPDLRMPLPLSPDETATIERAAQRFADPALHRVLTQSLVAGVAQPSPSVGQMFRGGLRAVTQRFQGPGALERAGKLQEAAWAYREAGNAGAALRAERRLASAFGRTPQIRQEALGGGVTESYLLTFADGTRGVFKPQIAHRVCDAGAEVAAYRTDRLLGVNRVPLTVEYAWHGRPGSLQYYVEGAGLFSKEPVEAEIQLFDLLIGNDDRHLGNRLLVSGRQVAIDHGSSFRETRYLAEPLLKRLPARERWIQALRSVPEHAWRRELGGLVSDARINAFLSRRETILTHYAFR